MTARSARWQALLLFVLIVGAAQVTTGRIGAASDKTIFVAALDQAGKPVKGLTAADFALREDGTDREITEVKPATEPLQIALLVDTTKAVDDILQDMRRSLVAFVRHVLTASPETSIRVMEFGQAAVGLTPFSASTDDLEKAVTRIAAKPGAGSVLLEAIIAASNDLGKRPSPRRAIVAVNLEPSDEQSREEPKKIIEALRKSVAQVWSISYQRGAAKNPQRDLVLNTLAKNTGGRREFIVGVSAIETLLKDYANALTSQYEVTYKRPEGRAQVVQVGIRREGVKLYASGFAPQ